MGLFGSGGVDVEQLAGMPLFSGFSDSAMKDVAKLAKERHVAAGETFIEQGRFGEACYVISDGTANIYISGAYITSVRAGTTVGEMALLERRPRMATIIAETDMVLAEFEIPAFRKMLERYPETEERVNALLEMRVRENADASADGDS